MMKYDRNEEKDEISQTQNAKAKANITMFDHCLAFKWQHLRTSLILLNDGDSPRDPSTTNSCKSDKKTAISS
jgi:hypothetical protein